MNHDRLPPFWWDFLARVVADRGSYGLSADARINADGDLVIQGTENRAGWVWRDAPTQPGWGWLVEVRGLLDTMGIPPDHDLGVAIPIGEARVRILGRLCRSGITPLCWDPRVFFSEADACLVCGGFRLRPFGLSAWCPRCCPEAGERMIEAVRRRGWDYH